MHQICHLSKYIWRKCFFSSLPSWPISFVTVSILSIKLMPMFSRNTWMLIYYMLSCFTVFVFFAEVLVLFKIDLYNLYKYDTHSILRVHQCYSRMVRFSKIRSALNRSIFVMLCTLVLIFSVTPHQTKHVFLAVLISATLTNLKICLKSSKFENGSEIWRKLHSVGVVLQIDWRLSTILKTSKKSVWSNVFWYVKVYLFWKYIRHWDKTEIRNFNMRFLYKLIKSV